LDFLQYYEEKENDYNEPRNSVTKPPTHGMPHSSSMPKLGVMHHNFNKPDVSPTGKMIAQTQRPTQVSNSYNHHPHHQQIQQIDNYSQRLPLMPRNSTDYQNQEGGRSRSRRNSYNANDNMPSNSDFGHFNMTLHQNSTNMVPIQGKSYSNNPSPNARNTNYSHHQQFDGTPKNIRLNDQQNESFVSLLNDQINTMNDEVKRLAQNSNRKKTKQNILAKASTDDDDISFPLLTQSEKEVKQMKVKF